MKHRELDELQARLLAFARERDWEQFHNPKNLVMALSVEASELLEHFQWLTPEQSEQLDPDKRREVALEMADIFIYLMRLAERLDVNLLEVVDDKIALNESRYPADKVRGSARKYSDYE
jgi:NTP pyrophosphatase (non-canonical NTP hydrolase)